MTYGDPPGYYEGIFQAAKFRQSYGIDNNDMLDALRYAFSGDKIDAMFFDDVCALEPLDYAVDL